MAARGDSLPYIIASPQCPGQEAWQQPGQQALLVALLDHITNSLRMDTNRVYLTGLSMGGFGSWRLAAITRNDLRRSRLSVAAAVHRMPRSSRTCRFGSGTGRTTKRCRWRVLNRNGGRDSSSGRDQNMYTTLEHVGHNSWEARTPRRNRGRG